MQVEQVFGEIGSGYECLNVFSEREAYYNGEEVEMPGSPDTSGGVLSQRLHPGKGLFKGASLWRLFRSTNSGQLQWMPGLLFVVWFALAIIGIVQPVCVFPAVGK